MKKIALLFIFAACQLNLCVAQTAKSVLDKCAAVVSVKDGISAQFTMQSSQFGGTSGKIAVKGRMFHASTPVASMWFDGSTQWTYLQKNNEVSVTKPTEAQLQAINPYNFITLYKKGYKMTMTQGSAYDVHLTAEDSSKKIQEMFIKVNKTTYAPMEVKLRQGNKWTTFTISNLKKESLADTEFRFNAKDFPTAEVIDLR